MTDPDTLYQNIWNDLESSMEALDNGGLIDMVSLDKKVRDFCEIVTKLPGDEAKVHQPKISEIIEHLTKIVEKLNARKIEVGEEISSVQQRQKANKAYGTSMLNNINNSEGS